MMKRFSVRFDLSNEKDASAWAYIHQKGSSVNQAVIDAILTADNYERLENVLTKVVSQAITGLNISNKPQETSEATSDDSAVFDFLSSF